MNYGRMPLGKWTPTESRPLTPDKPPAMPSRKSLVTTALFESAIVGTSHESPVKGSNSFSFTHFRKNASASPLESHTFKTKDLKCPVFTHFQKKGGGHPTVKSEEEAGKKETQRRQSGHEFLAGHLWP